MKIRANIFYPLILMILICLDGIILLNIPFIRPIAALSFFSFIPGFLILRTLKIYDLNNIKSICLSLVLSLVFIMIFGFVFNFLHFIIPKPFSIFNLLIALNFIVIILTIMAYRINKSDIYADFKGIKFISPALFCLIFPFLAIIGTYVMNNYGNNLILISLYLLIPIYVVILVKFKDSLHNNIFPLALFMISLSVVWAHTLISNYPIGRDIHIEYYIFKYTAYQLFWDPSLLPIGYNYNACLSVTILPLIYSVLMGIDGLYIFKVILPFFTSFIPVICFFIFKKYTSNEIAFLGGFLIVAQFGFIQDLQSATRSGISLLFFAAAILTLFDKNLTLWIKRILIILFIIAITVSHYTTAYLFLICLLGVFVVNKIFKKEKYISDDYITLSAIILFLVLIFFWYGQLTTTGFEDLVGFLQKTIINLGNFFTDDLRDQSSTAVVGQGVSGVSRWIALILQNAISLLFTIGLFYSLKNTKKSKFEKEFLIIALISWTFLVSMLVLPYVSQGYGTYRTYLFGLVTLSPMFFIGTAIFLRKIRLKNLYKPLIVIIIVLQFLSVNYIIDQSFGNPLSEGLNHEGDRFNEYYVYSSEISGSSWITIKGEDKGIYTDYMGFSRIMEGYSNYSTFNPRINRYFFANNKTIRSGYIYLRNSNLNGIVYPTSYYTNIDNFTGYSFLFENKSEIFDSGRSEVYL